MPAKRLHQKIEKYCAWYKLARGLTLAQIVTFSACGAVTLFILSDKIFYFGIDYVYVIGGITALSLIVLLAFLLFYPRKAAHVSYVVDKAAGLKNLVSSGMAVTDDPDEVSALVVDRATAALSKQSPPKLIPFKWHWTGRFIYIPFILLLASILLPHIDVVGRKQKSELAAAEKEIVNKGALKLSAKLTSIEQQSQDFQSIEQKQISGDFTSLAKELMGVSKKDALLKLGEFENKYKDDFSEQRQFEKAAIAMDTKPDMTGLSAENKELIQKLTKNLKSADFKDAAEALRDLAEQLKSDNLSVDEKKALAREMKKIAEQMKGAGASDDLAKLLREMESSTSPQDMQKLMEQCKAAAQDMSEMADFCDQAGDMKSMKDGLSEAKQAMLGDSFSDFDAKEVEQYLDNETASLGGEGNGQGNMPGKGKGGTGGEGQGKGGTPLESMSDTSFKSEISSSKVNKGKILHQLFISGIPEKGEARVEYADVVQAAKQHAANSLARDRIPREYEDIVKGYFDSIELQKQNDVNESTSP